MMSLAPVLVLVSAAVAQQPPVNPASATLADFSRRVDEYAKLHRSLAKDDAALRQSRSFAEIREHADTLAEKLREKRAEARPGDIFTPETAAEFRRLLGATVQGNQGARIEKSMERAEPVKVPLHVNGVYPASIPLQSTPATLLANLPVLPHEVEYRIVGHTLVLLDPAANLVVDYLPNAIP